MRIYIHTCIYTYILIYTYIFVYVYLCEYIYYICIYTNMYIHVCTLEHTQAQIQVEYACRCVVVWCSTYVCTRIYTHADSHMHHTHTST